MNSRFKMYILAINLASQTTTHSMNLNDAQIAEERSSKKPLAPLLVTAGVAGTVIVGGIAYSNHQDNEAKKANNQKKMEERNDFYEENKNVANKLYKDAFHFLTHEKTINPTIVNANLQEQKILKIIDTNNIDREETETKDDFFTIHTQNIEKEVIKNNETIGTLSYSQLIMNFHISLPMDSVNLRLNKDQSAIGIFHENQLRYVLQINPLGENAIDLSKFYKRMAEYARNMTVGISNKHKHPLEGEFILKLSINNRDFIVKYKNGKIQNGNLIVEQWNEKKVNSIPLEYVNNKLYISEISEKDNIRRTGRSREFKRNRNNMFEHKPFHEERLDGRHFDYEEDRLYRKEKKPSFSEDHQEVKNQEIERRNEIVKDEMISATSNGTGIHSFYKEIYKSKEFKNLDMRFMEPGSHNSILVEIIPKQYQKIGELNPNKNWLAISENGIEKESGYDRIQSIFTLNLSFPDCKNELELEYDGADVLSIVGNNGYVQHVFWHFKEIYTKFATIARNYTQYHKINNESYEFIFKVILNGSSYIIKYENGKIENGNLVIEKWNR